MKTKASIQDIYREGTSFRYFLLCILITGLSYGLYKGMLDNYLAEVVAMGEMDRGITEFFPGAAGHCPGVYSGRVLHAVGGNVV